MATRLHDLFRSNVRRLLVEYGWTQNDLAEAMGVTKGYVSQVLGAHVGIGLEMVDKFAAALEVSPESLISESKATAKAG